jgi:transcriptional regulator with XRE-family HTH domain
MTWTEIRAYYAALYAEARAGGVTQKDIADRGGIAGQNTVSRLISNDRLGPSVEIFVRAVEGLGKSLSGFFGELEQIERAIEDPPPDRTTGGMTDDSSRFALRLAHYEQALRDHEQARAALEALADNLRARLDQMDARVAELGARDGGVPTAASPVRTGHFG